MKRSFYLLLAFILLGLMAVSCGENKTSSSKDTDSNQAKAAQKNDDSQKAADKVYSDTTVITRTAVIKTNFGDISVGLYGEDAPKTVNNFIGLAEKGFYNGILFHRVVNDFVIQAGDPYSKSESKRAMWGEGGESIYGGPFEDELDPKSPSYKEGYQKGVLAMANSGPNTNTSQFFICLENAKRLDHNYTIFGKVIDGMGVVDKIGSLEVIPTVRSRNDGIPVKTVKINSVTILPVE